jgi:hypothetical protein
MPTEKLLDAQELEAPLPLEYAIKIARSLQNGEYLKMLHRMMPCKLGEVLDKMQIRHIYFKHDGVHYFFGWLQDDDTTKQHLLQRIKDEYGRVITI